MGKSRNRKRKHHHSFSEKWDQCFSRLHELKLEDSSPSNKERSEYLAQLQEMKGRLNDVKSRLNDFDIVKWHTHTKKMHLCGKVVNMLTRQVNAELVTQAWAKFYTILSSFDLFKNSNLSNLNTVHLCEAPGSFVTSLNHFLVSQYGEAVKWKWTATTLNPYHEENHTKEMIADDRFIIETLPNWDFGADFTGNIMIRENMECLKDRLEGIEVDLVTADGSLDCSENPAEQESCVGMLLLWETITALQLLREGGIFVLKMFTSFERFTVSLLYLLHSVFHNVTFIKPGPSKPGNSEAYVVCEQFQREKCVDSDLFHRFRKAAFENNAAHADVFDDIPTQFLSAVVKYSEVASSRQIDCISENLASFTGEPVLYMDLDEIKSYIAKRFLKDFSIYPIENYVSPFFVLKNRDNLLYDRASSVSYRQGSFNERTIAKKKTAKVVNIATVIQEKKADILLTGGDRAEGLHEITYTRDHACNFVDTIKDLRIIRGKKAAKINSSRFLSSVLVQKYREAKLRYNTLLQKTVGDREEKRQLSYHYELNKIDQLYPSFGLFQKKTMLILSNEDISEVAEYFSKKNIIVQKSTVESSPKKSDDSETKEDLILCDIGDVNKASKTDTIRTLQSVLARNASAKYLLLRLEGLPLTCFWHGVFFLLSQLFVNLVLVPTGWSKDVYYIMFHDCSGSSQLLDRLSGHFNELLQQMLSLDDSEEVLHVVDIYLLMQSEYRTHMLQRIGSLGQKFVDLLSKIYE